VNLKKNKAVFLDRDGIINVDTGYVHEIEGFTFQEGVFSVLKHLQSLGYLLIVVTNQSGIARGYYTQEDYQALTMHMVETLAQNGIGLSGVYHCPHAPDDGCACRKPKAGMLKTAQKEFNIVMRESWMIGDKDSDMLAGKNAGIKNRILVADEKSKHAHYHVKEVLDIAKIIV